ncbi:uncharacterized protein CDAR_95951 [Caerostris darwini]|uniref:Uncharacterized protein n=1 Tax=Caerostris darwini TaxID=1538125 RepID=A0AAV4UQ78_9ARAC|nr:uncharacterized protein CDAR_95951 [Caerostris darwini]
MSNSGAERYTGYTDNHLKRRISVLKQEYKVRVKHQFDEYLFVALKNKENANLEETVDTFIKCNGYKAHRPVHHKDQIIHFYVRFASGYAARAAVKTITEKDERYLVEIVETMLMSWFFLEVMDGRYPWTLAFIDLQDLENPGYEKAFSQEALQGLLVQFGDPRICCYQVGDKVDKAQVLFSTMSEALGASIALGCWYTAYEKQKDFYRLQIISSAKEVHLVKTSVGLDVVQAAEIAFELEYFVQKFSSTKVDSNPNLHCMTQEAPFLPPETEAGFPQGPYNNFTRGFTRHFKSQQNRNRTRGKGRGGRGHNNNRQSSNASHFQNAEASNFNQIPSN